MSESIPAGSEKIPMDMAESIGFRIGQKIRIGDDQFSEERYIVGFGSIILDRPLRHPHAEGERITILRTSPKEDTFHKRAVSLLYGGELCQK